MEKQVFYHLNNLKMLYQNREEQQVYIILPSFYQKESDLANIVVHLVEKGIRFGSSDHLVSEALYLNDPDGNGIEIYIDRDPSEWSWKGEEVAMTVDPLDFENLLTTVITR